jgi:hypothetical protein
MINSKRLLKYMPSLSTYNSDISQDITMPSKKTQSKKQPPSEIIRVSVALKDAVRELSRLALTLTVHHSNFVPEDNRLSNLCALCTACHLSFHNRRRGNVSPGQLSLF